VNALKLMYNNDNTQEMLDPEGSEINRWTTMSIEDAGNLSHTLAVNIADRTEQWFVDFQIPLTALKDNFGNQLVYPDTPIRLAYSTSASNTDPLQKDWMGYTPFGDVITLATPAIRFTDQTLAPDVQYYYVGGYVYVLVTARNANTDSNVFETITVTVTDPLTGDVETLTLRETAKDSGIFSNQGAATDPVSNPATPRGWIPTVYTYRTAVAETWTATYNGTNWDVAGTVSLAQGTATAGTQFTSNNGAVSFTIYENKNPNKPQTGDTITFQTYAADPLPTSSSLGGGIDDGTFRVNAGDWIMTRYVENSVNYDDWAQILGPGTPIIRFTRADGTDATSYTLTEGTPASDPIYVTVNHAAANTNPDTVQTIYVVVTGTRGDSEGNGTTTIALTETDPDTGEFRNTSPLPSFATSSPTPNNGTFEEYVGGIATATYTYPPSAATPAALSRTSPTSSSPTPAPWRSSTARGSTTSRPTATATISSSR